MRRILACLISWLFVLAAGCNNQTPISQESETGQRIMTFSGYTWMVKSNDTPIGPGPNFFSDRKSNVWVDDQGRLHLKITQQHNQWYSAEIISEDSFGYGEYVFYLTSRVDTLDQNVVLGLFTWDDHTFQTEANSEIDLEFARWGRTDPNTLQYAVQPSNEGQYPERWYRPLIPLQLIDADSTHIFNWTDSRVSFASYHNHGNPTSWPIDHWQFDDTSSPRRKTQGSDLSDPVIIPKPSPSTKVHLNLWLYDADGDGYGDPPTNGGEVEVIIDRFEFNPHQ